VKVPVRVLKVLNDLNVVKRWIIWNGPVPVMNGAKRLNGWNDWNGPQYSLVIERFDRPRYL